MASLPETDVEEDHGDAAWTGDINQWTGAPRLQIVFNVQGQKCMESHGVRVGDPRSSDMRMDIRVGKGRPLKCENEIWRQKTRIMGLSYGEEIIIICRTMRVQPTSSQAGRETDRFTMTNTALCIASRGKIGRQFGRTYLLVSFNF